MGFYSLSLGVLNPKMIIEAFEPQPKTFSVLQKNILINNLEAQVIANNCGIGSKSDSIEMYIPKFTGSGGGSFADLHQEEGDAEKIQVSVLALDSRISEGHKIDFMKVDVEGFEFEVITGALGTIQRDKPTIVIELLRKWMAPFGKHPQDVINQLEPFGYSTFAIGSESLIQTSIIDEDTTETNFIFVHKDNLIHTETLQKYI
jgi:FkbM family methyltransferase